MQPVIEFASILSKQFPLAILILSAVGFLSVAKVLAGLLQVAWENHVATGVNVKKFGAGNGSYALITGSTDGIGKEFAMQFARLKFNIVLVSRTLSKLEQVQKEIEEKFGVSVRVLALDFSQATPDDYADLKSLVTSLPVSVLVNNVAMNHVMPTPFVEESDQVLDNIINVNIGATVKITKICLPGMIERGTGLVLNVGSFAGQAPTPYLQTYSGSKAFLRTWSESLASEVKPLGVHVEHLNTYFVVSNMSKISRPSAMIPTANVYVRNVIKRVGLKFHTTPYPIHNLMSWALETFVSRDLLLKKTLEMQKDIRKRALKKAERAQKSQ